jgi:hypothetical protein
MFLLILILFLISILKVVIVLRGGRVVKHEELYVNLDDISVQPLYTIIIPIFMEKNKEVLGIRCHLLQMNYTNFEILFLLITSIR